MINLPSNTGFCYGVKAAVERAEKEIEGLAAGRKAYLFGDLVNNQIVMEHFKAKGFFVISKGEIDSIEPDSTVIVRAHGVPKDVFLRLGEKSGKLIDCTCPKVKGIHRVVEEKTIEGYTAVIIGKKGHPEVKGIFGWCAEGSAYIAESESDLDRIVFGRKNCVVAQTTCKKAWWDRAVEIILNKCPDAEIHTTLCDVTSQRIQRSVELAHKSCAVIVAGDYQSANSVELFEACKDANPRTVFVTCLEDLLKNEEWRDIMTNDHNQRHRSIGITGSASTPSKTLDEINNYLQFTEFLASAKSEIQSEAELYLEDILGKSKDKPYIEAAVDDFRMQNRGGKCIRGAMVKLGAQIAGGEEAVINYIPIALAYEFFQTSILIHDDIIDNSHARRGKSTIHSTEANSHFGISRAICIGDYGLFLANKIISESGLLPGVLVEMFKLFSKIQLTTLEGEIMDISLPHENITPGGEHFMKAVDLVYEMKTAWYTLVGPLMLGGVLGGAKDDLLKRFEEIAMPLGIAFQLKDDLLGIYGDEKALGKPAISDIAEKKQTLLYGYAHKHASDEERTLMGAVYGNPNANNDDLIKIRELFDSTGAKAFMEKEIGRLTDAALEGVKRMDVKFRPLLGGLASYLTTRIS